MKLKNIEYFCLSSGMRKKLFNAVADRIKQHLKTFDEKSGKKQEGKKASAQSAKVQRFIKVFYTYFN